MSSNLTPLDVIARVFGSLEQASAAAGLGPKAAYAWRHPTKTRDAGDLPSARLMRALLVEARARGIPLEHRHLIDGADAAEIDALTRPREEDRHAKPSRERRNGRAERGDESQGAGAERR